MTWIMDWRGHLVLGLAGSAILGTKKPIFPEGLDFMPLLQRLLVLGWE